MQPVVLRSTQVPRFPLGQVVITPGALETLTPTDVQRSLSRHQAGDWGDCPPADAAANDLALTDSDRLLSVYHSESGVRFWIITEADRSATTLLLPEEY